MNAVLPAVITRLVNEARGSEAKAMRLEAENTRLEAKAEAQASPTVVQTESIRGPGI
jgi:hypothetical protein